MSKEAFYFSHDYGSRNDPKLQKVLMKMGHEGKSVYWDLVEMLYEEGGYLHISEFENYAFALRTNEDCITKLITEFGLFQKNEECFWSDSILRRLERRDEKSKKASESARLRWENANASKTDANAMRPILNRNAIKERKGKDIKEIPSVPVGEEPRPAGEGVNRVQRFVDTFNKIKKSKYKVTPLVKTRFAAAIKSYSPEQIISVIHSATKDPKHVENNCIYVTPEFVLRVEIMERYLNMASANTTTTATARKIDHRHLD